MNFCTNCGVMLAPRPGNEVCENCDPTHGASIISRRADGVENGLEALHSTKSGAIKKKDSLRWLKNLKRTSPTDLPYAVLPKPAGFEGGTYETDISNIRVTGDARFIETVAGLFCQMADLENDETRLEINLQRTRIRDTKQYTGNYALYLAAAERSGR